jgi:anti-anti-sigma factor
MHAEIIDKEHEIVFILTSDLISSHIKEIESMINGYMEKSTKDITLDLVRMSKIDSMSIAALIRIKNKLISQDRGFRLMNPGEGITRVLEISGLESFLLD